MEQGKIVKLSPEESQRMRDASLIRLKKLAFEILNKENSPDAFLHALVWCAEYNLLDGFIDILNQKNSYMPNFETSQCYDIYTKQSILSVACQHGAIDIVRYLVCEMNVNVNLICGEKTGNTPLHFIAIALNTTSKVSHIDAQKVVDCAKLLIDKGAVEVQNLTGHTFIDIMNYYIKNSSFLTGYNVSYCKQITDYYHVLHPLEYEPSNSCVLI